MITPTDIYLGINSRYLRLEAKVKISYTFVLVILMLNSLLFARDKTDVLVMNNGDRFTCEIKGLDQGILYIGLDYVQGTVQVDWNKVSRVESSQLFLVRTQNGRYFEGTLSIAENEAVRILRIEAVKESQNTMLVHHGEVVGINQTSEKLWQRFNGAINSGFTYSKANETMQYSLGTIAEYIRERWSSGANYVSTLSGSTGATTSTRNNLTANYRHLMRWDNWFYTGVGSLLQSTEQRVQLQSNFGVGIGRYLKNSNRSKISAFGGLGYQNTRYTQGGSQLDAQNTAVAMAGATVGLFAFDKTKLNIDAIAIPALNQPARVYNNINTSYYIKFWGNFTWNLSFYGSWDNQPPPHFSGSDYGMTSGLGWTFGNYNSYSR